jgi:hypothetical protein
VGSLPEIAPSPGRVIQTATPTPEDTPLSAAIQFKRATRAIVKLKALIMGPSGSGKTLGALTLANAIAPGKVAVIDSENDRSSYYADRIEFDVLSLPDANPKTYMAAIDAAVAAGYEAVVIDSISHAWKNILDRKDLWDKANPKEKFTSWNTFGTEWEKLVRHILEAPIHLLATARSKQAYEKVDGGKIEKLGMQPMVRDGSEYEFALVFDLSATHMARATKDNTGRFDGETALWNLCDGKVGAELKDWLAIGTPLPQPSGALMKDVADTLDTLEGAGDADVVRLRDRWKGMLRKGVDDAGATEVLVKLTARMPKPAADIDRAPVTADTSTALDAALVRLTAMSTMKGEDARSCWNLSETKSDGFARDLITQVTKLADQMKQKVA